MSNTLLVIDPGLKLWGSERALLASLASLADDWQRIVLVTPKASELSMEVNASDHLRQVEVLHAPIGNLHKRGRVARLNAAFSLLTLCAKVRPSRLYLNQAGLCRIVRLVALLLNIPMVVHVRLIEDVPRVANMQSSPRSPLALIFVSNAMFDAYDETGAKDVNTRVSYDPYVLSQNPPMPTPERDFVCLGRVSEGKGQHLLVDAAAQLAAKNHDINLDIFGSAAPGDSYLDRIKSGLQAQGVTTLVRLHDFRKDVLRELPKFRFLVAPSKYEPLGRVIIEAWDAGIVPIVYADSGGAAEIVRASGGGLIFSAWTPESLAETMASALRLSSREYRQLVNAGRQWGMKALSVERYRDSLDGILYSVGDLNGRWLF